MFKTCLTFSLFLPMLLTEWEDPWNQEEDSCQYEANQGQEGLLICSEMKPGKGEMAKLEDLVKRTHLDAWSLQISVRECVGVG